MRAPPLLRATLLGGLAVLGIDFFVHGGLLAGWYTSADHPFLLDPRQAMLRIPLGYLAIAATALLIAWTARRAGVEGWRAGARFGLVLGALLGVAQFCGLLSIARVPPLLLAAWALTSVVEAGVVGAIAGAAFGGARLRRLGAGVAAAVVLLFVVTALLQALSPRQTPAPPGADRAPRSSPALPAAP